MPHNDEENDDLGEEKTMSVKKLVKIMNLCQIYIPIIQIEANNST